MRGKILFSAVAFSLAFGGVALAGDDYQCFKTKDTAKVFAKTTVTVSRHVRGRDGYRIQEAVPALRFGVDRRRCAG